jgi:hypothetical protein
MEDERLRPKARTLAKMGKRAAAYVADHTVYAPRASAVLVADCEKCPAGVSATLTRLFGRPRTIDRGEIAYWTIEGDDIEAVNEEEES